MHLDYFWGFGIYTFLVHLLGQAPAETPAPKRSKNKSRRTSITKVSSRMLGGPKRSPGAPKTSPKRPLGRHQTRAFLRSPQRPQREDKGCTHDPTRKTRGAPRITTGVPPGPPLGALWVQPRGLLNRILLIDLPHAIPIPFPGPIWAPSGPRQDSQEPPKGPKGPGPGDYPGAVPLKGSP